MDFLQERKRYENPHKAFTYRMHGYESVVGPVKGVYSSQSGMTNKARGHLLLVDDRPPYVTILSLGKCFDMIIIHLVLKKCFYKSYCIRLMSSTRCSVSTA